MRFEGQQIGRYHLSRVLGSGGMGTVYLAEDPRIEQQVAIKVVEGEPLSHTEGTDANKEASDLFIREVKAIAKLDHPNILPLFDYGEDERDGAKITYIVMPYRKEGSLAVWLKKQAEKSLPSATLAPSFLAQAAKALQHAHEHQIIHQDVKPSNFLLRDRTDNPSVPDLLLADFGIAKFYSASVNMSITIRGTPTYMAPEQWRGYPVFATDQYALAVMMYQILTGRPPFNGNLEQLMYAHINEQPPSVSMLNPRLSPALDTVLLRAMAKQVDQRFPSLTAFDAAFQEAWQKSPMRATPALPVTPIPPAPTPPSIPPLAALTPASIPSTPTPASISPAPTPVSLPQVQAASLTPSSLPSSQAQLLQATLAISPQEAQNGTLRVLNLPGGEQVQIPVQPGSQDGQILRLEKRGGGANSGTMETLLIKLAVVQTSPNLALPADQADNDQTYMAHDSQTQLSAPPTQLSAPSPQLAPPPPQLAPPPPQWAPPTPISGNFPQFAETPRSDHFPQLTQTQLVKPPEKKPARGRIVLLSVILLVILIVAGSIGGIAHVYSVNTANQQAMLDHTHATATVIGRTAFAATATASWIPYPPNTGHLLLNDPLVDNSKGYHWPDGVQNPTGASCSFKNGAYHIFEPRQGRLVSCSPKSIKVSDFVFEVQMSFITGTTAAYGGITFRATGPQQYFFRVGRDGTFFLKRYLDITTGQGVLLKHGSSPLIQTALNATNTVAIVAQGGAFNIYVNHQLLVTINDSGYSSGQISLVAEDEGIPTEVAFSNAKAWSLSGATA